MAPPEVCVSVEAESLPPPPIVVVELSTPIQGEPGPQGPPGTQGEQGLQGIPGPMGTTYPFTQSSPSALWTIPHNLNRYPDVTVVDSTGRVVEGDAQYVDANTLTVAFSAPFSGEAFLN